MDICLILSHQLLWRSLCSIQPGSESKHIGSVFTACSDSITWFSPLHPKSSLEDAGFYLGVQFHLRRESVAIILGVSKLMEVVTMVKYSTAPAWFKEMFNPCAKPWFNDVSCYRAGDVSPFPAASQACRFFRTETDDDLSQLRLFKVADFHHGVSCLFAAPGQLGPGRFDWLRLELFDEGRLELWLPKREEKTWKGDFTCCKTAPTSPTLSKPLLWISKIYDPKHVCILCVCHPFENPFRQWASWYSYRNIFWAQCNKTVWNYQYFPLSLWIYHLPYLLVFPTTVLPPNHQVS